MKIEFDSCNIMMLLNRFYFIPDYQRDYVWSEKEVTELLEDIFEEVDKKNDFEYYLGTMVICKNTDKDKFEVIDGQQRLITISLVVSEFARIMTEYDEDPTVLDNCLFTSKMNSSGDTIKAPIVEIGYEGKEIFEYLCKNEYDKIELYELESLPGGTIYSAYDTIKNYISTNILIDKTKISKLKKFMGKFINNVKVTLIETPDVSAALKIFETINDRGVGLDSVDLLKNLIFRQVTREEFKHIKEQWGVFKHALLGTSNKEKPLRFLRYYIMSTYEINDEDNIIREDNIFEWFVENKEACGYEDNPLEFLKELRRSADFYMKLYCDKFNDSYNIYLENIRGLVGKSYKQHFILLLATRKYSEEMFNKFAKRLEELLFVFQLTKTPARDVEKLFASWAKVLSRISGVDDLEAFIGSKMEKQFISREAEIKSAITSLAYGKTQKYRLKYILAKMVEYIDRQRSGDANPSSLEIYTKRTINIEHIMPEKYNVLYKAKNIKEYNANKMNIGNLTLLEQAINKSIQDESFDKKVMKYIDSNIYLTKSLAKLDQANPGTLIDNGNCYLKEYNEWGVDQINERKGHLFKLACEVWGLPNSTEDTVS